MIAEATRSKLYDLGLGAMAGAWAEQEEQPGTDAALSFAERLGLVERSRSD